MKILGYILLVIGVPVIQGFLQGVVFFWTFDNEGIDYDRTKVGRNIKRIRNLLYLAIAAASTVTFVYQLGITSRAHVAVAIIVAALTLFVGGVVAISCVR